MSSSGGSQQLCTLRCAAPIDCSTGYAPTDEDNYACEAGYCVYTGCNSDAECMDQPGTFDYVCR